MTDEEPAAAPTADRELPMRTQREIERQARAARLARIEDLAAQLNAAQVGYLVSCGWRHTSATADSVWRWRRKIGDEVYLLPQADALHLQEALNE